MDLELLRLRRRHHAPLIFLIPPFRRRRRSIWRGSRLSHPTFLSEYNDSARTDLNPVALVVIPHIARQSYAAPTVRVNVLAVCSESVLYNGGVKVGCVACFLTARAELKLAAIRSLHSVGVRRPTPHLYLYISSLSKTPLHCSAQRFVSPRVIRRACASWLGPQPLVLALSVDCRICHNEPQKTTYQLLVVVSTFFVVIVLGTVVHVFSSDSRLSRSTAAE